MSSHCTCHIDKENCFWCDCQIAKEALKTYKKANKRYREALEEIMKIQENHEWNLYGIAYGIAERTLFEVEGEG